MRKKETKKNEKKEKDPIDYEKLEPKTKQNQKKKAKMKKKPVAFQITCVHGDNGICGIYGCEGAVL